MGYKVLGFVVWKGAQWFLKRRVGKLLPSGKVTAAVVVALAVGGLAAAGARRDASGA
jgi:hypothetical protein